MSLQDESWPDSLWRATAEPLQNQPTLDGDIDTEVAVIGAGFTGLSCALHLAELGQQVTVIDKVQPGWGCSGRNGGQVNPNWKVLPNDIRKYYSDAEFERVLRAVSSSCDFLFELIGKHDIKCDAVRPGYVMAVTGKRDLEFARQWARQWRVLDTEVHILDRQKTADLLGTDAYDAGMLDGRGGSVQPLSYARGMARACLQSGVSIYGDTKAVRIEQTSNGWKIQSPYGEIRCRHLVVGTNGYTDGCFPGLKQTIVPVASLITATEPLPAEIVSKILPQRNAVSDTAGIPVYYRLDAQNRMVFGGRATLHGKIGSLDTRGLRKKATQLFPLLQEAEWQYDWGGYVAMTSHHRPMLLKLGTHAYAGLGYSGRGVAMATLMGQQLACAVVGRRTDLPIDKPQKLPMHALYPAGVAARMISGRVRDLVTRRLPIN